MSEEPILDNRSSARTRYLEAIEIGTNLVVNHYLEKLGRKQYPTLKKITIKSKKGLEISFEKK